MYFTISKHRVFLFILFLFQSFFNQSTAVAPGCPVSEYARNVVGLGEMERSRAKLFEPKASFWLAQ